MTVQKVDSKKRHKWMDSTNNVYLGLKTVGVKIVTLISKWPKNSMVVRRLFWKYAHCYSTLWLCLMTSRLYGEIKL